MRDVSDIWNQTTQWLSKEFNYRERRGQNLKLLFKGKEVDKNASLHDAGIVTDATVFVVVEEISQDQEKSVQSEHEKTAKQSTF